jgi:hypothetical protein
MEKRQTFQLGLGPIEIWYLTEIFPIQIQKLPKLHQFPKLFDKLLSAHAWLPRLRKSVRQKRHRREIAVELDF